jgi:hypothetical protein
MNLLAFETVDQYKEVLHDKTFVKLKYKKWPTVGNETMKKYAYTTWQPDAQYVILLNEYRSKDNEWVKGFKGKRLCVIDGDDRAKYYEPFVDVADIYVKENSYCNTDNANVRIGCYCPSMKVPFLLKKGHVEWKVGRKWDWFWAGDMHCGRKKRLNELKIDGIGQCVDGHDYDRVTYLKNMSNARVIPSMKGKGDRCRREWEALLCGGMLLQDPRLMDYPFVIMRPETHFTFNPVWDEGVARAGYDLARKCWMQAPSIDLRMAALYTFCDVPQMWTYEEVEEAERKL